MSIPIPADLAGALTHVTDAVSAAKSLAIRDAAATFHVDEDTLRTAYAVAVALPPVPCRCFTIGAVDGGFNRWVNGGCAHHPATGTHAPSRLAPNGPIL
jgi:hypothetical protein